MRYVRKIVKCICNLLYKYLTIILWYLVKIVFQNRSQDRIVEAYFTSRTVLTKLFNRNMTVNAVL